MNDQPYIPYPLRCFQCQKFGHSQKWCKNQLACWKCGSEGYNGGEVNMLFNVTINDISVIYVTAHRCAGGLKKKLDLRSGSQRHRHFVGFFNVPVLAPTRDHPFYTVIPTHRPIKSPFTITLGIRWTHSRLNPPGPHGGIMVVTAPQRLSAVVTARATISLLRSRALFGFRRRKSNALRQRSLFHTARQGNL